MKTFVYYHGAGCYDGFTAAWIAKRALAHAAGFECKLDSPVARAILGTREFA